MNRYLSKLSALCLCLTLALPSAALAAEGEAAPDPNQPYAQRLAALGVFQGTGGGFELERTPMRSEGVTMLVRLIGGESEAKGEVMLQTELPFTDVDDWAHGYVAYAWTQGLTNGTGETTFGSNDPIDTAMYTTFLLRCLGYSDGGEEPDFIYARSIAFAQSLGLYDEDYAAVLEAGTFTRGELARMSCAALEFLCKDSEDTLLEKLLADGKVTAEAAAAFLDPETAEPGSGDGTGGPGGASSSGGPGSDSKPGDTESPEVPETIPMYAEAPWCPDFGALFSREPSLTSSHEESTYAYCYEAYTGGEVDRYAEVLLGLGYEQDPSLTEALDAFDDPKPYRSGAHIVVLDRDAVTGVFMVYTA